MEKRRHPRITFRESIRVNLGKDNALRFEARDLNLSGISFYTDQQVDPSDGRIELLFSPPNGFVDDISDLRYRIAGRVIGRRIDPNTAKPYLAVEFNQNLSRITQKIYKSRRAKGFLAIFLTLFVIICLKILNVQYYWYSPLNNFYSLIVTTYILSRFFFAFFYKTPKVSNYYPTVSFVVPVKNEEAVIAQTVTNCFSVNYPKKKLEVIVINDGSTDNTFREIQKIKNIYPLLEVVNFEHNQGKRHAMAAGAKLARGEIIVYVDSDSLIRPNALFYLVQGFRDPHIGAVCGQAYVYNSDENILTKMQEVRYFIAFRVIKAAEHVFSCVTCCSGSLSAYRREYLMAFIDEWLNQTFLGMKATFGDDRSLTNFILKKHRVLYDARAEVETVVPSTWKKFLRQQLRWKKSWFRESLIASQFMWRKHPIAALAFYTAVLLPLISPFIIALNFVYRPIFLNQLPLYYTLGFVLISFFYSLYYLVNRPNRKWIYGVYFCLFYMAVLSWQTYYAIFTSRKNHWGTR